MKRVLLFIAMLSVPLNAQHAPVLLYSDIDSGPSTHGEGGKHGAFLCVYGENFGSTRGTSTVTIGGVAAAAYKLWDDPGQNYQPGYYAKACVQINKATPSGMEQIQLVTPIAASNTLPFTVRPGDIHFVATSGDDSGGNGSSEKPWRTITRCKKELQAGDICYIENGVTVSTPEKFNAGLVLNTSGMEGRPKAIIAYPGATVKVDLSTVPHGRGLQSYLEHENISYWTIAGLSFNSDGMSVQINRGGYLRFIDNDVMCTGPQCNGPNAGLHTEGFYNNHPEGPGSVGYLWIYGNRIHDVGCHEDGKYATTQHPCGWQVPPSINKIVSTAGTTINFKFLAPPRGDVIQVTAGTNAGQIRKLLSGHGTWLADNRAVLDSPFTPDIASPISDWRYRSAGPSKLFHNVYFSTNTNHVWFGWNSVNGNGKACRGVQFHSTGGVPQYDLHVHDNVIHDTVCDGLNFATVNPSLGAVEAYNNVIYNTGTGPDPGDGAATYSCIYSPGGGEAKGAGSGAIQIYNNTMYNCGDNPTAKYAGDRGAIIGLRGKSRDLKLVLTNNIIVQPARIPYLSESSNAQIGAFHNDCYGIISKCPTEFSNSLNLDPGFMNLSVADFHLSVGSALRKTGGASSITPATDLDGHPRGAKSMLGAYE